MIIDTFFQARSIHRTVKVLAKAGVQIPYRCGQRIVFRRPSICRVRGILTKFSYAGTYVYAQTQSQVGGPVLASGFDGEPDYEFTLHSFVATPKKAPKKHEPVN